MNLQEIHQVRILEDLLRGPEKIDTKRAAGPYGMLVEAMGGNVSCQIVSQQNFFENVPDFPRDRTGTGWFLVEVGDDDGTRLFVYPWSMVKDVVR